mmetsp:Transcript_40306/g.126871  ORF Transcript_40306/g.126871 Transcript_40306/m.126871 type:complete len:910 (-) Transcript_40306:107-2836(-)
MAFERWSWCSFTILVFLAACDGEQMCPAPDTTLVCSRCPNACPGPECAQLSYGSKCAGGSWLNINSTFMSLNCAPPPGLPAEKYPAPLITSPQVKVPLSCEGQIKKGLWPFDADNMTFSLETMFQVDSSQTADVYTSCLEVSLQPTESGASDLVNTDEALACPVTSSQLASYAYSGLSLFVCLGTKLSLDPYCRQGRWVEVITGACVGERVFGDIELTDPGTRLLMRVGGPTNITGCQTKWKADVTRTKGGCRSLHQGYGSCCISSCVRGYRLLPNSCQCICPAGYAGILCEKTEPHLDIVLTVFNITQADWVVLNTNSIGKGQMQNQYKVVSAIADTLSIPRSRVEFGWADAPASRRREFSSESPAGSQVSVADPGRRASQRCDSPDVSVANSRGISMLKIRLLSTFEYELPLLSQKFSANVESGAFENAFGASGLYICIISSQITFYNAFAYELQSKTLVQKAQGITISDVILIVFSILGALTALFYLFLYYMIHRSHTRDATEHLRKYKPVQPLFSQALGWSFAHPITKEVIKLPSSVSRILENAYIFDWLQDGRTNVKLTVPLQGKWIADFSEMRAYETLHTSKFAITRIVDAITFGLDASALPQDHFYDDRTISVTEVTSYDESRNIGQVRKVISYNGKLRELKVDRPFIVIPTIGCQVQLGGKSGLGYYNLLPPGMDVYELDKFAIPPKPSVAHRKRMENWLHETREVARGRLAEEIHYPTSRPLPPTAQANLQSMAARMKLAQQASGEVEAQDPKHSEELVQMSGKELRDWQSRLHEDYVRSRDARDKILATKRRDRERMQIHSADSLTQIRDQVYLKELFNPDSGQEVLQEVGVRDASAENRVSLQRMESTMRDSSASSSLVLPRQTSGRGSFASRLQQMARASGITKVTNREVVEDEVAV